MSAGRYIYEVELQDIRPDGHETHKVRQAADDAAGARRVIEAMSDIGLRLRGIERRGVIVTKSARRLGLTGKVWVGNR